MGAFLILFGLVSGIFVSGSGAIDSSVVAGLFALAMLGYAIKMKKALFFLVGFAVGLLLGFIPIGPFSGQLDAVGLVIASKKNYVIVLSGFKRIYVPIKNHTYQLFDFIYVHGNMEEAKFATYESRFDFSLYLHRSGVATMVENAKVEYRFGFPIRFRELEQRFLSKLSSNSSSFYRSLLFNVNDHEGEVYELASGLGLFHLLSASGILFQLLLRLIKRLLYPFELRFPTHIAIAAFALLFLPIGLAKPGILRVIFIQVGEAILKIRKKEMDRWTLTSLVGILIIAVNPYLAMQSGYLLSFGIVYFLRLSSVVLSRFTKFHKKWITMLFVYAFLFLFLSSQGEIHLFALPFGLILTPFVFVAYILGYFGFFLNPVPGVLNGCTDVVLGLLRLFDKADLSLFLPFGGPILVAIYYPLLIGCLYLCELGDFKKASVIAFTSIFIAGVSLCPFPYLCSSQISFINVGQGDAILLRDHDKVVLLDTGGIRSFDLAQESLIPYLKKQRIYHIDAVIASHHDYDHIGAYENLNAHFDVRSFYDDPTQFPVDIGIMHFENLNDFGFDEENDRSLVFRVFFMNKIWMLTGDASTTVEEAILSRYSDLDCDILKLGHHGSNTSTSGAWLDALTPETAIISVGYNNRYGHPNQEVLDRLNERNIQIRRTDIEGTITYTQFG